MEVINVLQTYQNRMNHALDELNKIEGLLKEASTIVEQELIGKVSDSLHDKLSESTNYIKSISEDILIAKNKLNTLQLDE